MRTFAYIVAALAVAIGAVWALQGANLLGGSFMTGQSEWLWIGVATALAGCAGLAWLRRGRRG